VTDPHDSMSLIADALRPRLESDPLPLSGLSRTTRAVTSQRSASRHRRLARARAKAPQEQTLQELFLASRERFVRIAYRILQNNEHAEDAVQDAFLSACRHYRGFEGRSALTTWLTRIVMNAALMLRRKRKSAVLQSFAGIDADSSVFAEAIPDARPNPKLVHSQAESHQILDALLRNMNPLLREVLMLTCYHELSMAEASSLLGVSLSTYKTRLFRARRLLKKRADNLARRRTCSPFPLSSPNNSLPAQSVGKTGSLMRSPILPQGT
jgi:RNA polymerase sigma-70 factor, ECF subfamily